MKMYFLVNVGILHCSVKNCENGDALPETNIFAPENGWLEDEFPFGMAYFQVRTAGFRGCIPLLCSFPRVYHP